MPFQFGDLPLLFGDPLISFGYLLISFGYLVAETLDFLLLPFQFAPQFFPAWRLRGRMPTPSFRIIACALSGSRIHSFSS